ncbi:MAG: hemerythrin domain-containing protein [Candidatus Acidiferrales bacterium]
MPVQIGANVHCFSNPTGLLSDCHRRFEMFLGSLEAVGKTIDRPLTEETARALTSALRYFREAAPKHTADEEESLFPRLRQIRNPEVQAVLARVKDLERDHRWATAVHAKVDRLGQRYLSTARLSPDEVEQFRAAVSQLAAMYREHIRIEDSAIFPVADRLLSQTERASIAREMAVRRNIGFPKNIV